MIEQFERGLVSDKYFPRLEFLPDVSTVIICAVFE
jgi:hypothetical protein